MKMSLNNSVIAQAKTVLILAAVVLTLSVKLYSQVSADDITGSQRVTLSSYAVENLKLNISSDNQGVKRSAIYYAGYYKVKETVNPLMIQLRNEKDPSTRILIALSLFKLNDTDALNLIKEVSAKDSDANVRRMCNAIYFEYSNSNNRVVSR